MIYNSNSALFLDREKEGKLRRGTHSNCRLFFKLDGEYMNVQFIIIPYIVYINIIHLFVYITEFVITKDKRNYITNKYGKNCESITGLIKVGVSLCQREKESMTSVCTLPKVLLIPWGHQCIHEYLAPCTEQILYTVGERKEGRKGEEK